MAEDWPDRRGDQVFQVVFHPAMAIGLRMWMERHGLILIRDAELEDPNEIKTFIAVIKPE